MKMKRTLQVAGSIFHVAILLAVLLCIMFLYTDYSAQIPFKLVFLVLLVQLVVFEILVSRVKIAMVCKNGGVVFNDENTRIIFQIDKGSLYPFKKVEYLVKYRNHFEQEYHYKKVKVDLREKKKQSEEWNLGKLMCGYYEMSIENVIVFDLFGFGSRSLTKKSFAGGKTLGFVSLPAIRDVVVQEQELCCMTEEEAEERFGEEVSSGNIDIYDIREFEDGDKLNKIHWKLSSKQDEWMVRDTKSSLEQKVYVFFDLCSDEDLNEMFTQKTSLCAKILEMGYSLYVSWFAYSGRTGKYINRRELVTSLDQLQKVLLVLLNCPLYQRREVIPA